MDLNSGSKSNIITRGKEGSFFRGGWVVVVVVVVVGGGGGGGGVQKCT